MIYCELEDRKFDESYCKTCEERIEDDPGKCMFANHIRELERERKHLGMPVSHTQIPTSMQGKTASERFQEHGYNSIHPLINDILKSFLREGRE